MPALTYASQLPKARQEIEARFGLAEYSTHRTTLTNAFKTLSSTLKAQVVSIGGSPTGGTFTLQHGSTASSAIAYDAAASAVESALESIAALAGFIAVTGPAGGPWIVIGDRDLLESRLVAASSLTGGSSPTVEIKHLIEIPADREQALESLFAAAERAAEGLRNVPDTPASNFTPASLSSCVLWLDAQYAPSVLKSGGAQAVNGDAVDAWVDRIGGSITFSQVSGSGPTFFTSGGPNGTRFLRGDGAAKYLRYAAADPLNHTAGEVFVVLRANANGTQVALASADEASTTRYAYLALFAALPDQNPEFHQNNAGTSDRLRGEDRVPNFGFSIVNIGSNGTTTRIAVGGGPDHSITAVSGSNAGDWFGDSANRDNVTLFALRTTSVSSFFNGDIAEVIVTNAALTTIERNRILAYLRAKYTPLAQVTAFGDSHIEGDTGVVDSLRPLLAAHATLGGLAVVNRGVGSETISQIRTRWVADATAKNAGDVLVFLGGTNDIKIASAGAAEATLWPLLESTYDEAIAAGMKVVAITVYPFYGLTPGGTPGWTQTRQTELEILNRLIKEKCARNPGIMQFVDAYKLLGDPDEPRMIRRAYAFTPTDYLHTNVAGDNVVATAVLAALRELLT